MTTIAAAIGKDGRIWMAGDSAATYSDTIISSAPKVWRLGEMVMGGAGYLRNCQLVRECLEKEDEDIVYQLEGESDERYIMRVADAIKALIKDRGMVETSDGAEHSSTHFLVGFNSKLYIIASDAAVVPLAGWFYAIGSGCEYAIGYMAGKRIGELSAANLANRAVATAAQFDDGTKDPVMVLANEPYPTEEVTCGKA